MSSILSDQESKELEIQKQLESVKAEKANIQELKKVKVKNLLTAEDKAKKIESEMAAVYVQEFENQPPQLRSFHDLVWTTARIMRDTEGDVLGVPICMGG